MTDILTMADAIEDKLLTLFEAESALDDVKVFFQGEPRWVPQHDNPFVIVFVTSQNPREDQTGVYDYDYLGVLAVEEEIVQEYDKVGRRVTLDSHTDVRRILDAMSTVLEANIGLDDLTFDNETCIHIRPGAKSYFVAAREQAFSNRGELEFSVKTLKPEA